MKTKLDSNTNKVFWAALAVIICASLPVLIENGGNLYLVGDYMTQQIPFIKECRRMLRSGAPFWSSNTFLGSNFLGTYSFYNYGSPFYWPLYLIPEAYIGIGLSVTFALKHAVAAVTAHVYLKKHVKTPHLAFIGALIYAFSSFTMDSTYYFHFIDVIAVFPLIPYLVDEVLENRKKAFLALAVLLNAMINYYFFFITSVFFLIYLAFRVWFSEKAYSLRDAVRCIAYYAIGGFGSMFILLPSALSLLETYKATSSFASSLLKGLGNIPQLLKLLKGIVLPSEGILGSATGFTFSNFNSNAAFLPFFGALFLFVALMKKEKTWYYKLMKFLFILTLVPFGNGIFSFFTNMSYTRWWYCFVLTAILVSIRALEEKPEKAEIRKSAKTVAAISAVVIGIPLLLKLFAAYLIPAAVSYLPQAAVDYLKNAGLTEKFTSDDLRYCAVLVLMTAASYLPLYFSVKKQWIFNAKRVIPVVAIICAVSYCAYLTNEAKAFDTADYKGGDLSVSEEVSYSSRTQFDYRFANYPAVANRPGITAFHSFKSHSTAEFCRLVGYKDTLHATATAYFDTPAIQSLLSIETLVDSDGNETQAPYYSPFGYSYDYYVIDEGYEYSTDKKENNARIELMTKACFVDEETAAKIKNVAALLEDTENVDWEAACAANAETASVEFELNSSGFTAKSVGDKQRLIYFSIPHDKGWAAYVNGKETEILTVNGGMMAIIVPAGECNIEFTFITPGLLPGAIISGVSLIALVILTISDKKKKSCIA